MTTRWSKVKKKILISVKRPSNESNSVPFTASVLWSHVFKTNRKKHFGEKIEIFLITSTTD